MAAADDPCPDTATLTIAPTVLSKLPGFMIERNVFYKLTDKIEAAIPIANLAKAQRVLLTFSICQFGPAWLNYDS